MAGHTVVSYDYLLTFDLEIDYMWCTPWTTVKVVFLLNRYGTLIGLSFLMFEELGILSHGSRKFCAYFQWFQALLLVLSSETIRTLLLLRAWSLWRCSYRVTVSLVLVYVFYVLAFVGRIIYVMVKYFAHFDFQYLDETRVCILYPPASSAWLLGFISFLLDTVVFAVIAYYLYKLCRRSQQLQHSPLLRLLLRDAILFYMVNVFHDTLVILCMTTFLNGPRNALHMGFSFPLLIVTGQRAVLNLRGFQSRSCTMQDVSHAVDMQLAVMRQRSWWQSVDLWMNDPHQELHLNEELTRDRMTRATGLQGTEEERSYELQVIYNSVGSRRKSAALDYALYDPFVHSR